MPENPQSMTKSELWEKIEQLNEKMDNLKEKAEQFFVDKGLVPNHPDLEMDFEIKGSELRIGINDKGGAFWSNPFVTLDYEYHVSKDNDFEREKTRFNNGSGGWESDKPLEASQKYADAFNTVSNIIQNIDDLRPAYRELLKNNQKLYSEHANVLGEIKKQTKNEKKEEAEQQLQVIKDRFPDYGVEESKQLLENMANRARSNPSGFSESMTLLRLSANPDDPESVRVNKLHLEASPTTDGRINFYKDENRFDEPKRIKKEEAQKLVQECQVESLLSNNLIEELGRNYSKSFEMEKMQNLSRVVKEEEALKGFVNEIEGADQKNDIRSSRKNRP